MAWTARDSLGLNEVVPAWVMNESMPPVSVSQMSPLTALSIASRPTVWKRLTSDQSCRPHRRAWGATLAKVFSQWAIFLEKSLKLSSTSAATIVQPEQWRATTRYSWAASTEERNVGCVLWLASFQTEIVLICGYLARKAR